MKSTQGSALHTFGLMRLRRWAKSIRANFPWYSLFLLVGYLQFARNQNHTLRGIMPSVRIFHNWAGTLKKDIEVVFGWIAVQKPDIVHPVGIKDGQGPHCKSLSVCVLTNEFSMSSFRSFWPKKGPTLKTMQMNTATFNLEKSTLFFMALILKGD